MIHDIIGSSEAATCACAQVTHTNAPVQGDPRLPQPSHAPDVDVSSCSYLISRSRTDARSIGSAFFGVDRLPSLGRNTAAAWRWEAGTGNSMSRMLLVIR